jgi:hypothetical protein
MEERNVRERAYQLWEEEGRPEGRHEDHWYRAEREMTPERGTEPDATIPTEKGEIDERPTTPIESP